MSENSKITAASFRGHPDLMTVKEIQNILHIGRSKAYAMLQNGEIKSIRAGVKYLIPKPYLIEFLNEST